MTSKVKILKYIEQEERDIVSRYIKQYVNQIPSEIINMVLLFYFTFKFDTEKHGKNLEFSDDGQTVSVTGCVDWTSCIYGSIVTDQICDTFEIYFIFDAKNDDALCHMFGYIPNIDLMQNHDWNSHIGDEGNEEYCVGFLVAAKNSVYQFDKPGGRPDHEIDYRPESKFVSGDQFGMIFNFVQDSLSIYHNDQLIEAVSLNGFKSIIPAFSFCSLKNTCKIIKYNYN